ncbi:MAG: hypothetical protein M1358_09835 [Chloroflexi bacterium]|nr:hypothetical protein [Chloroflexota bacterium]
MSSRIAKHSFTLLAIIVLISTAFLVACGGSDPTPTPTKAAKSAKATATPTEVAAANEDTPVAEGTPTKGAAGKKTPTAKTTPLAKSTPTKTSSNAPVTKILSATTCRAVDSEKKPIDPIATFHPNDTIYASAELQNFPKGAEATGNWYFGDQFVDGATVTSSDDYSTAWVSFDLTPTEPFPVGEYRIEILLGDTLAKTLLFNVEDQPGQAEQKAGLKTYNSTGLRFQMGYPKDWTTKEDETSVSFSSTEPNVGLFVYSEKAGPTDTIEGLNGSFIDAAKADYPDLTVLGNQSLDFAGENWLETDFYYTDESGTQQAWVDIVALRSGVAYFVVLSAPLATFEQTRQASFLPMLESFKFT